MQWHATDIYIEEQVLLPLNGVCVSLGVWFFGHFHIEELRLHYIDRFSH